MTAPTEEMMKKVIEELQNSAQRLQEEEENDRKQLAESKKGEHGMIDISEKMRGMLSGSRYSPYGNAAPPRPTRKLSAGSKKILSDCISEFLGESDAKNLPSFLKK
eukprot:TRINITY_DN14675_c0_g1_i1.p1 TRINITY_DN14675_c0_g1~~TRINITY_DN14675_c0_g1_i1.p1  ORF type:complete len:124 (+),score=38.35 TRINITY_DN14675_c0_g1_i1:55-372(+)